MTGRPGSTPPSASSATRASKPASTASTPSPWTERSNGSSPTTLQNEGWHDWSPDGRWLAVELFDDEQTQFHIGLMDGGTKEMKILTDTAYPYQQAPVFVGW